MDKPIVVVSRKPPASLAKLYEHCNVWEWEEDRPIPRGLLLEKIRDAAGIFTMIPDQIDGEFLAAAPKLRTVCTMAVGVDNIDVPGCTARGIPVGYAPRAVTEATADLSFCLILALSRRILESAEFVAAGKWEAWSPSLMISNDVFGKTLGVFGMGRIGQAVSRRARGFDMTVIYHDVVRNPDAEQALGAAYRSFDDLLAEADILTIHAPFTPETRHIFNAAALSKMKPGAFLVNAARGGLVHTEALYDALRNGVIKGAALDVTDPEPIEPASPLISLPNCIIVPHVGTSTWETRAVMTDVTIDNLINALNGETMIDCFNLEALKG